jgi:hypothetical protein
MMKSESHVLLSWVSREFYPQVKETLYRSSIAQQKFVTGFGAPVQYFKQLGNNLYQPGIYLCPTALVVQHQADARYGIKFLVRFHIIDFQMLCVYVFRGYSLC